jgi:hypothetical protein
VVLRGREADRRRMRLVLRSERPQEETSSALYKTMQRYHFNSPRVLLVVLFRRLVFT